MGFWRKAIESGEWKRYAVYAVEAYGIFKIGEMLGRRSMVSLLIVLGCQVPIRVVDRSDTNYRHPIRATHI